MPASETTTWLNTLSPAARAAWLKWESAKRASRLGYSVDWAEAFKAREAYFALAGFTSPMEPT